jgi:WD40 repeat protein
VSTLKDHAEESGCAFNPVTADILAWSEQSQSVRIRDIHSQKVIKFYAGPDEQSFFDIHDAVNHVSYSPDGKTLLCSYFGWELLRLWEIASDSILRTYEYPGAFESYTISCTFSHDGTLIAGVYRDKVGNRPIQVVIWMAKSGQVLRTLEPHQGGPESTCCIFNPNGTLIACTAGNTIQLWEVESGRTVHIFTGRRFDITGCAFSPDGGLIVGSSVDGTLGLWDVSSGRELTTWLMDLPLTCCAFHPSGRQVMAGDEYGGVHFLQISEKSDATVQVTTRDFMLSHPDKRSSILTRIFGKR